MAATAYKPHRVDAQCLLGSANVSPGYHGSYGNYGC